MSEKFSDEMLKEIKKTYRLVPDPTDPENGESICIEINEGPFKECVLQFGKVKMKAADETDELTAEYEYDIKYVPEHVKDVEFTDEEGEQFESMIGDILMAMFYEKSKEIEENRKNAENRDPDTLTFTI